MARQIDAFSRPEAEVLPLAGLETGPGLSDTGVCGPGLCGQRLCGQGLCGSRLCDTGLCDTGLCDTGLCGPGLCGPGLWSTAVLRGRQGEPVSGIRPARSLLGIPDGRLYLRGQRGQLVPAAQSDGRERLAIEHQLEGDLVWLACPVTARDCRHAQQRTIYAASRTQGAPRRDWHGAPWPRIAKASRSADGLDDRVFQAGE